MNAWSASQGTFTDPAKQQRKIHRQMLKGITNDRLRSFKAEFGRRATDEEVKELSLSKWN